MTASEKILAGILQEAEQAAGDIQKQADEQAAELRAAAEADADIIRAAASADAEKQAALIRATGKSGAELIVRDALLACRREEIDAVLTAALETLNAQSDAAYFAYLEKLFDAVSEGKQGEVLLSAADLARDTAAFRRFLEAHGSTLGDAPAAIHGGFILRCGDVEINAAFDALMHEKHEELVDAVNGILFD